MQRHDLRILLVEDNASDALFVRELLRDAWTLPTELNCVRDLAGATSYLETNSIDMVLLDLALPDSEGLQALQAIRGQIPDVPIVVLTGLEDEAVAMEAVRAGAQDFLAKTKVDAASLAHGIRYAIERSRALRELQDSEARYRSVVQNSSDFTLVLDAEGAIRFQSAATKQVLGYDSASIAGYPAIQFIDPEDAPVFQAAIDSLRGRPGALVSCNLRVVHAEGTFCTVTYTLQNLLDDPNIQGYVVNGRDITKRVRVESELAQLSRDINLVMDSTDEGIFGVNLDGTCTFVNRAAMKMTGHKSDELLGRNMHLAIHHHRRDGAPYPETDCPLRIAIQTGLGAQGGDEEVLWRRDGSCFPVAYSAFPIVEEGGITGAVVTFTDITLRKQIEEEIREQNRELSETTTFMNNVLESSTEYSIIAMDLEGEILVWNEGARHQYGFRADEMVGRRNLRLLHVPEDIKSGRVERLLETVIETGKVEEVFERVRKDGRRFMASVALTLRRDENGTPIGYVLISKDITEQNVMEAQLQRKNVELEEQNRQIQEANRLKSEFLANMSHELRTPLNGIIGFSELMHDEKVGPVSAEQKEYLGDILTSSRHLHQLIDDVLDISKIEAGKMEFFPEFVDTASLVAEVRAILGSVAIDKHILVGIEIEPTLGDVHIDPSKFKQVLYNYLSNAIKFTPDGGQVTIRILAEEPGRFRLEVEDTGIGIQPADVARLFTQFQQLDAGANKRYQGTGLGLALTKRIIEAQGGTVGVSSTPGKGSAFFSVLPRISEVFLEAKDATPFEQVRRSPASKAPAVLIVEEKRNDRSALVRTLAAGGYSVETATTGSEALKRCAMERFAAITVELRLPDMSGQEVLSTIRQGAVNGNTPVIVVANAGEEKTGLGVPVYEWLEKPVRAETLVAALQRAGIRRDGRNRVLLIDDDAAVSKLLRLTLVEHGYHLIWRSDGEGGLEAAASEWPDAVVLDLMMPGMDGWAFLDRFRTTIGSAGTPVIIWTSKDLTAEDRDRLKIAADAVLIKSAGGTPALIGELESVLAAAPANAFGRSR